MNTSKVFQNIVQTGARYQEKAKKVFSAVQIPNGAEKLANTLDCMASSNAVRISKSTSIVELLSKLSSLRLFLSELMILYFLIFFNT